MRLGVHVRIAGGLVKSLDRARELECEAVQLFSGNPNSWVKTPLDPIAAAVFVSRTAEFDIHPIVLHTPYLVNLASPDDIIWQKSQTALADAIARAAAIGGSYIVTHIGSHKGEGYEGGVARICEAVRIALETAPDPVVALEMGSGAGNSIGSRFEEIADIMSCLRDVENRVGICIDTAHLWGSGYDISTPEGVSSMFDLLKRYVGFDKLKVIHLNDTEKNRGSKQDRHYHIGKGQIGPEGFRAILNYPGAENLPGIIETPGSRENINDLSFDKENLAVLRGLRA